MSEDRQIKPRRGLAGRKPIPKRRLRDAEFWAPSEKHAEALRAAASLEPYIGKDGALRHHHGSLKPRHRINIAIYAKIINGVRACMPPGLAAKAAGLTEHALVQWQRLSEDDHAHPLYELFQRDLNEAIFDAARHSFDKIEEIGERTGDWQALHARVKCLDPALRPDQKVIVETQVHQHLSIFLSAVEREFPVEIVNRLLEIAASLGSGTGALVGPSGRSGT